MAAPSVFFQYVSPNLKKFLDMAIMRAKISASMSMIGK
eukprot:CAMPEP_0113576152 /NCGR_PEP_ID=MMETSP0015_2-20120614/28124_1 /TAXON_ID=2838 /ORGANISM="Odontella" /LENGTH=37 /DNA_ID=CAMNT_0000479529 /DNA_START=322 /DNA_END=432 /DNA_ORIENTATION=+ /assembly_acc=CAM_ASM_000160